MLHLCFLPLFGWRLLRVLTGDINDTSRSGQVGVGRAIL
jgi:hypothetical protein